MEQESIQASILREENKFHETLNEGLKVVNEIIIETKKNRLEIIPGKDAFLLYDTYGFPLDLMEDIAEENGLQVDKEGFEQAMEEQRNRARAARKDAAAFEDLQQFSNMLAGFGPTEFIGYESLQGESEIAAIVKESQTVESAAIKEDVGILLSATTLLR